MEVKPHIIVSEHSPSIGIPDAMISQPGDFAGEMPQVDRITAMEQRIRALEDQVAAQAGMILELSERTLWQIIKAQVVLWFL